MTSPPGRKITAAPAKPTATAAQRLGPTRSPSIGTESATTMSGAVKKAIVTAVRGACERAMM